MDHGHRENEAASGQKPVDDHQPGSKEEADRSEFERPPGLCESPADRAEKNERQTEQGDAEIGDPISGAEILVDHIPERIKRSDHDERHCTQRHRPGEGAARKQVDRESSSGWLGGLNNVDASDHWEQDESGRSDDEKWRRNTERANQDSGDCRPHREAEHVGGEQSSHVLPEVRRVGQDHDALDRRSRSADANPGDEAADQNGHERGAERHQDEAEDINEHPSQHQLFGMAAISKRGNGDLR